MDALMQVRELQCATCRSIQVHDPVHDEGVTLMCRRCGTEKLLKLPDKKQLGHSTDGRGPAQDHFWTLGETAWFRSCNPTSHFHSRKRITPRKASSIRPICATCKANLKELANGTK